MTRYSRSSRRRSGQSTVDTIEKVVERPLGEVTRFAWSPSPSAPPPAERHASKWASLRPKCLPFAVGALLALTSFAAGRTLSGPAAQAESVAAAQAIAPVVPSAAREDAAQKRPPPMRAKPINRDASPPVVRIADLPLEPAPQARSNKAKLRASSIRASPANRPASKDGF